MSRQWRADPVYGGTVRPRETCTELNAPVLVQPLTDQERADARLTVAEKALRDAWSRDDLRTILSMLDLENR